MNVYCDSVKECLAMLQAGMRLRMYVMLLGLGQFGPLTTDTWYPGTGFFIPCVCLLGHGIVPGVHTCKKLFANLVPCSLTLLQAVF